MGVARRTEGGAPRRAPSGSGVLLAVLGAALLLRIGFALAGPNEFTERWADGDAYLDLARSLAHEGRYWASIASPFTDRGPTSFWLPGYPVLLAAILATVGESAYAVYLVQSLIGAATVWLVYGATRILLGESLGLAAALLLALHPFHVFYVRVPSTEILATGLLAAVLYLAVRCDDRLRRRAVLPWPSWIALGLVLGAGILTRTVFLPIAMVLGAALLLAHLRATRRPRSTAAVAVVGGLAIGVIVAPWFVRNHLLWGEPIYHNKAGINLVIGYHDGADGRFDGYESVPPLSHRELDEVQRDRRLSALALEWVRDHPAASASLFFRKSILLWNPVPSVQTGIRRLVGAVWTSSFLALAVVGAVCCRRRLRALAVPCLLVVTYTASVALAFVATRFRIPVEAVVAVYAGPGLACLLPSGLRYPDRGRIP